MGASTIFSLFRIPILFWPVRKVQCGHLVAEAAAKRCRHATFCIVNNVGYAVNLEKPKTFNQEMLDFIGKSNKQKQE
ncbi:alpha/beta fold hydrolase [Paenibacillus aestuarii]|uniref:Alpha/beta fold hydrolase n=1 Tax=Paenibacillus aestuarii TaxID=516965 RepID=A0ABW0KCR0_9BACL|nr:hypothetical protein [Paenibacillus aestuarii]